MVHIILLKEIDPKVDVQFMKDYDIFNFSGDEGTQTLLN